MGIERWAYRQLHHLYRDLLDYGWQQRHVQTHRYTRCSSRIGRHTTVHSPVTWRHRRDMQSSIKLQVHPRGGVCVRAGVKGQDSAVRQNPGENRGGDSLCLTLQFHLTPLVYCCFSIIGQLHAWGAGPHFQGQQHPVPALCILRAADICSSVLQLHVLDNESPIWQHLKTLALGAN